MIDKKTVDRAADNMRILSIAMVEQAKSGHPGGALGGADFMNILYTEFLNYDPSDLSWICRDRFFLDPGHMSPMLYATLALAGTMELDELKAFRQWGSCTPGHPEVDLSRGIENTSGPLGQGHTMAVGAAIAAKFLQARFGSWMDQKIYTYISDGGIQEEISQGAGRLAGHLGLDNLIMFFDSNQIQLSSSTDEVSSEDTAMKYRSWGWNVLSINGNSQDEIRAALTAAKQETQRPTLIIGNTVMGKGLIDANGASFEGKCSTHGQPVSKAGAAVDQTVVKLGGDAKNPFAIFPEVQALYAEAKKKQSAYAQKKKAEQAAWAKANPELAAKLEQFFSGKIGVDVSALAQKANQATRVSSKEVLAYLAKNVENIIVSSADLSNSDHTDGFLNNTKVLKKGDFSGAFLQAGVAELTMAAVMNGISLHGGVRAACGTFFVFSEYMKPAVRLSALMEQPVIYIWTHDAFRVGEDGPTHQPIEQEAQIRLMEHLKNHSGGNSFLALRPADSAESNVCWQMALENTKTPTGLIFSRQPIQDLPSTTGNRMADAQQARKGAYIAVESQGEPDLIFVANGSEVSTACEGAKILAAEHGLKCRVVSAPSEGLFRSQPKAYQLEVLPTGKPIFGITAGLPVTLQGLVGPFGKVWGLDHFGYSAPFQVLDEKFGYTPQNIAAQALAYLAEYKK